MIGPMIGHCEPNRRLSRLDEVSQGISNGCKAGPRLGGVWPIKSLVAMDWNGRAIVGSKPFMYLCLEGA